MATRKTTKTTKNAKNKVYSYDKNQILNSERYINRKDILEAILEDEKTYEMAQVDELLNNYMKGEVK